MHATFIALCLALLPAAGPPPQGATPPRLGKEVKLFNGRDLKGWQTYLADAGADPARTWSVDGKNRILVCTGAPLGYISTVKTYSDYVLKLEWRWSPETKKAGNSGVLLRVEGEDKVWPKCIEAQLMSGSAGDFWLMGGAELATAPDRIDPGAAQHRLHARANEKPVGEWNTYEITCSGGSVTLKVNGVVVNEGTDANPRSGRIALQSEGAEIHFRNISLRPILPPR